MAAQYIIGNILDINQGVIAHQVNTSGHMGGGVAKALSDKFPDLEREYNAYIRDMIGNTKISLDDDLFHAADTLKLMGTMFPYVYDHQLTIANCFSQGGMFNHMFSHTSYDAIHSCFTNIEGCLVYPEIPVYVPFEYGCGIADGNWNIVKAILDSFEILDIKIVCRKEDIARHFSNDPLKISNFMKENNLN